MLTDYKEASLFNTFKKFKSDLSEVFVQMKLTVIKDEEKKNQMVPFISRYPNQENRGAQTFEITELIDMFPSLCELAGLLVYP